MTAPATSDGSRGTPFISTQACAKSGGVFARLDANDNIRVRSARGHRKGAAEASTVASKGTGHPTRLVHGEHRRKMSADADEDGVRAGRRTGAK